MKVALCRMECIHMTEATVNILRIYFSYNNKFEQEKNLSYIVKIQNILKLWKFRNLTIAGELSLLRH